MKSLPKPTASSPSHSNVETDQFVKKDDYDEDHKKISINIDQLWEKVVKMSENQVVKKPTRITPDMGNATELRDMV